MNKSYEEMAREAEEVKDTERELEGLVPVKARVARPVRSVYSVRMSSQELSQISAAAKRRGITVSDFMRQASLAAAQGALDLEAGQRESAILAVREKTQELYRAVQELDESPHRKPSG